MAFVDMGDQFLALAEGRTQGPDAARHFGLVVDDAAARCSRRRAGRASRIFGGNSFLDPWGNQVQVVAYREIQFSKTPDSCAGWGSSSRRRSRRCASCATRACL